MRRGQIRRRTNLRMVDKRFEKERGSRFHKSYSIKLKSKRGRYLYLVKQKISNKISERDHYKKNQPRKKEQPTSQRRIMDDNVGGIGPHGKDGNGAK